MGPLIPLFWTSDDVSSWFQRHSGQTYSHLEETHVMYIPWFTSGATPADLLVAIAIHILANKHW